LIYAGHPAKNGVLPLLDFSPIAPAQEKMTVSTPTFLLPQLLPWQVVALNGRGRRRRSRRPERGKAYSTVGGLYRQFELIYIAADERDVVRLRTNVPALRAMRRISLIASAPVYPALTLFKECNFTRELTQLYLEECNPDTIPGHASKEILPVVEGEVQC
jgi:Domain of unknown function (DUF4105)